MASPSAQKPPVKYLRFWEFLYMELGLKKKKNNSFKGDSVEKLNLFLATPFELEKFLVFGVIACLDNFLCYLTVYPLTIVSFFLKILFSFFSIKRIKMDSYLEMLILKYMSIFFCVYGLSVFKIPHLYHIIKGQTFIKIYVLYNFLEVLDKLMCSLGFDIIDYATQLIAHARYGALTDRVLSYSVVIGYSYVHSLIMLFQLICLNVAVNAHNHLLFSLFISNQIVEIKGSVFKKFDRKNLVYMCNHDARERFVFITMILCVGVSNSHFQPFSTIFQDLFFALISELVVDWIKHSFIIKFNHINHKTYVAHLQHLAMSVLKIIYEKSSNSGCFLAKRFSFLPLPLFIMTVYVITQSIVFKTWRFNATFFVYSVAIIFLLKTLTGLLLLIMVTYWGRSNMEKVHKKAHEENN